PGNGDGTLRKAPAYPAGDEPRGVAVGDFNGDGLRDLAIASHYNVRTVSILLGAGGGSFQAPVVYATGDWTFRVALGDFNRDGKTDLVTPNVVLLGNGDGTFQPAAPHGGDGFGVAVGDFNLDGFQDVASAGEYLNYVRVMLGKGDGSFQA